MKSGVAALTLAALNAMDRDAFTNALGGVFEHSSWIVERAWASRPVLLAERLAGVTKQLR